eukprot:2888622-Prymnesium_polylepis.1
MDRGGSHRGRRSGGRLSGYSCLVFAQATGLSPAAVSAPLVQPWPGLFKAQDNSSGSMALVQV